MTQADIDLNNVKGPLTDWSGAEDFIYLSTYAIKVSFDLQINKAKYEY